MVKTSHGMSFSAAASAPIPQSFLGKGASSKMAAVLVRFFSQRLDDFAVFDALPEPRCNGTAYILLDPFAVIVIVVVVFVFHNSGILGHAHRPICRLLRSLNAKLAATQSIQDAAKRLVRYAALAGDSASRRHRQLGDRVAGCLWGVSMVVQSAVCRDCSRNAGRKQIAGEVEAQLRGIQGGLRGVVWRFLVRGIDGRHPGERRGVVWEIGKVFFVQVFEEGWVVGVEVGGLLWLREVY